MPSDFASAKPRIAPIKVCDEETLIAFPKHMAELMFWVSAD